MNLPQMPAAEPNVMSLIASREADEAAVTADANVGSEAGDEVGGFELRRWGAV